MKNFRAYYSAPITKFLKQNTKEILGIIHANNSSTETLIQQNNSWEEEIAILKDQFSSFQEGYLLFEYTIPRMGKRVDVVFLHKNIVFLLEFKCGDREYRSSTYDQVYDYALDLRNFHKESHDKLLVPIIISTKAPAIVNTFNNREQILEPLCCNAQNINSTIYQVTNTYHEKSFNYQQWELSNYSPTPTIVEAAQALYRKHNVHDITRNDAGATNLTLTSNKISQIIEYSKQNLRKSICFVTGVPGAGKTLVGLNIAIERENAQKGEHAVFLSGNFPLVQVLQEALARDKVTQEKEKGHSINKKDALRETLSFIQIIHKYRDSFVGNNDTPPEKVAIFDEAQRSWTKEKLSKFMKTKKGIAEFPYSEPEFLISTMDRHLDWGVIICLIGGGQEINEGEAGLPEWFHALGRSFSHWDIYITPQLNDEEYKREKCWEDLIKNLSVIETPALHLHTSVRSFRTPHLAAFVKELLDTNPEKARQLYTQIKDKYPLSITRDLKKAKQWAKEQARGSHKYGLLASSGALRLKPAGIFVKNEISVANWFLNGKEDPRSCYALEDVVTEFDIQGLEIDYSIVAWDADFRFNGQEWTYNRFKGCRWNNIKAEEEKLYLKNTYRVLLTRARQGMVIFIPQGNEEDCTRKSAFYDHTFHYLKSLGIPEI